MNKTELYNEYCEKFEVDNGIKYETFLKRLSKVRTILRMVIKDKYFERDMIENEKIYLENIIEPILADEKIVSKQAKYFILPLIKYCDSNIFKYLKKEYSSDSCLENISCIKQDEIKEFIFNLNIAYIQVEGRKEYVKEIFNIKQFEEVDLHRSNGDKYSISNKFIISFLEFYGNYVKTDVFGLKLEDEDFINIYLDEPVKKVKDIKKEAELDVNFNYRMALLTYYRLCNCIERKRDNLAKDLFELMNYKEKMEYKNKIFKIIIRDIKKINSKEKIESNDINENNEFKRIKKVLKASEGILERYYKELDK